jgi:transcriptional regulator with XRE-family HTH domain
MYNEDDIIKNLGARIKDLRIKAGYTSHEKFANDIDISRSLYWSYEQGANMNFLTLIKILNFHKITVQEFFRDGFK